MCYPSPGPRCSKEALIRMQKTQNAVLAYYAKHNLPEFSDAELQRLIKIRNKAQKEYKITPAGIKSLQHQLAMNPANIWIKDEITINEQLRAERIKLAKAKGLSEKVHPMQSIKDSFTYPTHTEFSNQDEKRHQINFNSSEVATMMQDSATWISNLTDDEIIATRWYTQDGFDQINAYLTGTHGINKIDNTDGKLDKITDQLDSALAKHVPYTQPVILYRRHNLYDSTGFVGIHNTQNLRNKYFPVGGEFTPKFYLSTSLDLYTGSQYDNNQGFTFEIKTRHATPVSAVHQQGTGEFEFLLARNTKFRVVNNTKTIQVEDKIGEFRPVTIIQLEEI